APIIGVSGPKTADVEEDRRRRPAVPAGGDRRRTDLARSTVRYADDVCPGGGLSLAPLVRRARDPWGGSDDGVRDRRLASVAAPAGANRGDARLACRARAGVVRATEPIRVEVQPTSAAAIRADRSGDLRPAGGPRAGR